MLEIWRPFPANPSYEVSDQGRVRSLLLRQKYERPTPLILKPWITRGGYPRFKIPVDGKPKNMKLHVLVAATFLGPKPAGLEVRHGDGDPLNNRLANLSYGTKSENMLDSIKHGTNVNKTKTHCPQDHEYTDENTYINKGRRNCRQCQLEKTWARRGGPPSKRRTISRNPYRYEVIST